MATVTMKDSSNSAEFKKADAFANVTIDYLDEDGNQKSVRLPVGAPLHAGKSWINDELIKLANTGQEIKARLVINSAEKAEAPKGIQFL